MKKLILFAASLAFMSCTNEAIFTQTNKKFEEKRWKLDDAQVFTFEITEEAKDATAYLNFSHVFEPQYTNVPIAVVWQSPSGKQEDVLTELKLKDDKGANLSDCAGDVCDIKIPVKEHIDLEKGAYKVAIFNKFDGEYLPNVLAVGLSIEKK